MKSKPHAAGHLDLVPAAAGDRLRTPAAEDEGEAAGVAVINPGVCLLESVEANDKVNGFSRRVVDRPADDDRRSAQDAQVRHVDCDKAIGGRQR